MWNPHLAERNNWIIPVNIWTFRCLFSKDSEWCSRFNTSSNSFAGNIELSVILCLSGGHDNRMESLSEDLLQLINVYQLKPFNAKVSPPFDCTPKIWEINENTVNMLLVDSCTSFLFDVLYDISIVTPLFEFSFSMAWNICFLLC